MKSWYLQQILNCYAKCPPQVLILTDYLGFCIHVSFKHHSRCTAILDHHWIGAEMETMLSEDMKWWPTAEPERDKDQIFPQRLEKGCGHWTACIALSSVNLVSNWWPPWDNKCLLLEVTSCVVMHYNGNKKRLQLSSVTCESTTCKS